MGLPPRHIYRLTGAGVALAQEQRYLQMAPVLGDYAEAVS